MKYLVLILTITISIIANAQVSVGMRDNRFVYGAYTYRSHYVVALEESVFSEGLGYQYLRGYAGYKGELKTLEYNATGYFGSTYNRSYCNAGPSARAKWTFRNVLILEGLLNPHYDSGDGYTTCWYAGAGARITRHIDILAGYGNQPEYRLPEYRLKAGFKFNVGALSVSPKVSIMVKKNSERSIRPLIDFNYNF